jgi:PhnB protein
MPEQRDPLQMLHRPVTPLQPSDTFTRQLRAELERLRVAAPTEPPTFRRTAMTASAISLVPYLCAHDAPAAIEFYKQAFGAIEENRLVDPKDGRIGHAELVMGDVRFYLSSEYPEIGVRSPKTMGHDYTVIGLNLQVTDADAVFNKAIAAGATERRPLADQFYGDRNGAVSDPFGYVWTISSTLATVSTDEMQRRWDEGASE